MHTRNVMTRLGSEAHTVFSHFIAHQPFSLSGGGFHETKSSSLYGQHIAGR